MAYLIQRKHGLKRADIQWTADTLVATGLDRSHGLVDVMQQLLKLRDREFDAAMSSQVSDKGTSIRRLELSFLNAQIHRLDVFTPSVQRRLLQVATDVHLYNEVADEAREYFMLTFDSDISPENHRTAQENLHIAEASCVQRARIVADGAGEATKGLMD